MQTATTQTFSLSVPTVYEHILILRENIMLEHKQNDNCLSYVSISLEELSYYDYYEGDDLLSRFLESCLEERGPVEVIADSTLPVAGFSSYVRTAQSPRGKFYYFGLVPVNSEYGCIIIADCDSSSRAFYEPLIEEIWQSLQCFGDPATAFNAGFNTNFANDTEDNREIPSFTIPANGREYCHIGEHMFTFEGESECYISDGDGALYVKIDARAPGNINPEQSDIISSYENGKVYLQFYFKGIYNAGIPTGKFHFENERDSSHLAYLWKGGFQYTDNLTVDVTLEEGWLGINGYLNEYPVKLAVKLRVAGLDWKEYHFLSIQEVTTATPDIVRQLWLTDPDAGLLQETIQPLTQLEVLSIAFRDSKKAAALVALPEAVKHLKELKELSLTDVSELEILPQWLAELKKLESIRLCDSKIATIHADILQLPALTKLYLTGNQLRSVPPTLSASLESLILSNNQLTTVPESFTTLQHLAIENNPLQQLPAVLENIPYLQLELEKKITLLNYTYYGAGGKGTIAYVDNHFYAKYDPELLTLLEQQINAAGLEKFKAALINHARRSVALETTEADNYLEKGNHRFGGLPDLPPGESYPTFIDWHNEEKGYRFIAQINCAAIAHLQDYLPRTGILYFFIKDQEESEPKVVYYEGDNSSLQWARDLNIDPDFIYDQTGIFTPYRAECAKYASIPPMYNAASLYPELAAMEEAYEEAEQLQAGLKTGTVRPVHSINSYVFKQHGTPEIAAADAKRGKPDEWMVLLRVSSDSNPGFVFWDAGEFYFVIHKSDLEKKDFSNVYCGLESS